MQLRRILLILRPRIAATLEPEIVVVGHARYVAALAGENASTHRHRKLQVGNRMRRYGSSIDSNRVKPMSRHGTTYGAYGLDCFAEHIGLPHAFAHPQVVVRAQVGQRTVDTVHVQLHDPAASVDLGIDQREQVGKDAAVVAGVSSKAGTSS